MKSTTGTIPSNSDTLRCDCSLVGCGCCDGFDGHLKFKNLTSSDANYSLQILSGACSAVSCKVINNSNGKKLGEKIHKHSFWEVYICT